MPTQAVQEKLATLPTKPGCYLYKDGNGTVLRHEFSAFGPISDEMAKGIEWHGSLDTFADQLHAWIDRGEVIPPPE